MNYYERLSSKWIKQIYENKWLPFLSIFISLLPFLLSLSIFSFVAVFSNTPPHVPPLKIITYIFSWLIIFMPYTIIVKFISKIEEKNSKINFFKLNSAILGLHALILLLAVFIPLFLLSLIALFLGSLNVPFYFLLFLPIMILPLAYIPIAILIIFVAANQKIRFMNKKQKLSKKQKTLSTTTFFVLIIIAHISFFLISSFLIGQLTEMGYIWSHPY